MRIHCTQINNNNNNKLIYAHKKSTAVLAPVSPKLNNVNRITYVQISYTKFHPN